MGIKTKKIIIILLITIMVFSSFPMKYTVYATEKKYKSDKLNNITFVEGVTIKEPFEQTTAMDCAVGKEDGVNVLYTTSTGVMFLYMILIIWNY